MNKRLTIISIAFSIAYIFLIGYYVGYHGYNSVRDFKEGFKEGLNEGRGIASEHLFTVVQPKQGLSSTPTSVINQKTGENMEVGVSQMAITVYNAKSLPLKLKIADFIKYMSALFVLGILIYIPVQSFKVLRSLVKNVVFDMHNIKRIRNIGYSLLIIFAWSTFNMYVDIAKANYLVELKNYKFTVEIEMPILFLGLVILAFAEILKMALSMKEENDLTI